MKNKIIHCEYDKDCCTYLGIRNKYGTFFASSQPADEDKDIANKWTGGRLAEYKCEIQSLKKKYQIMNQRAKGIEIALHNIVNDNYNSFSESDWNIIKKFERQANIARRDADNIKDLYLSLEKNYKKFAEAQVESKRNISKDTIKNIIEDELKEPAK